MKTPLVILGAGGFGREVHDVVEAMNDAAATSGYPGFDFLGFIDNHVADPILLEERGAVLLGGDDSLGTLPAGTHYVIAIGNGRIRRALDEKATALGLKAATLVHPAATIGKHLVVLGPGAIICSHVSITTNIRLGRHVHLNLNVTVGHEAVLGDYVTVHPGATISGNVVLEDEVMIGTGAALIPGVTVGAGSVIGAGACVVRNIPGGVTAVGMPAKAIGATR
jgi:sugar O-acyltransferase (sialic acid O-acetyltransferase NeuD family)